MRRLTMAGSLLLAALLCAVVLTHPSDSTAAAAPNADSFAVSQLAGDYPILAQPQRPADAAADNTLRIGQLFGGMPEALVAQARVVNTNEDRSVILVPRSDGLVCLAVLLADGGSAANCNTSGVSPVLVTYGAAIGTVPASVTEVTYTLDDGSTQGAKTQDGLYYAPADAAKVSFGTGDDATTAELMPASSAPAGGQSAIADSLTPAS